MPPENSSQFHLLFHGEDGARFELARPKPAGVQSQCDNPLRQPPEDGVGFEPTGDPEVPSSFRGWRLKPLGQPPEGSTRFELVRVLPLLAFRASALSR